MKRQIVIVRWVASRARLIVPLSITMILLAGGVLLSPSIASGALIPTTAGPTLGVDDYNTSTLNPSPAIAVSTIASIPPGQCAWINTGLAAFSAANPADGSGPSGQGWTFAYAGAAVEAQVEAGISILDYYAWAVNIPAVTDGAGNNYPANNTAADRGGAVFNLRYTPQPGAPVINNLHWIQGVTGTIRGTAIPTGLDNFTSLTTFARDNSSPFYDGGLTPGAAGTLPGGGGWFLDIPWIPENEYELNPVASIQFQVVLAGVTTSVVNGVTQNAVTLYGGEWWGFEYTAVDVPEPSTLVLLALGGMGLLVCRRVRVKKPVA